MITRLLLLAVFVTFIQFVNGFVAFVTTKNGLQNQHQSIIFPLHSKSPQDNDQLVGSILSELEQTQSLIEEQQRKIESLTDRLRGGSNALSSIDLEHEETTINKSPSSSSITKDTSIPSERQASGLSPLKVMIFIDGTWMYYSAHEREDARDTILHRFGKGWQYKYRIDWDNLPRIVCQALDKQYRNRDWSTGPSDSDSNNTTTSHRPIEVVRVTVFTSYKADTPKTSLRYKMFQEMLNAKYDVNMMETTGKAEKCVDIQLAVDMLHYATVPNAYDIAMILTGDKDYMPAMVRCRQKGRRVGLISMRPGCNRALVDAPNLKDFDVIWLEDHLDDLIKPRETVGSQSRTPNIAEYTLMRLISDYVDNAGVPRISSRDMGRYLKSLHVGERCVLDEIKATYGGLYQFLIVSDIFFVDKRDRQTEYWVTLRTSYHSVLSSSKEKTTLTNDEKKFFDTYDVERLTLKDVWYPITYEEAIRTGDHVADSASKAETKKPKKDHIAVDFNQCTVEQLKTFCRERSLLVSGRKSDLVERLQSNEAEANKGTSDLESNDPEVYLEGLMLEYLQVKGGKCSSRDVGRYLQVNTATEQFCIQHANKNKHISALMQLKEYYGSVRQFAMQSQRVTVEDDERSEKYAFFIRPSH